MRARMLNRDFKELLQLFAEEGVRFLVVGDYALGAHGYPRATKGMDVFVGANRDNAAILMLALSRFGVRLHDVTETDFSSCQVETHVLLAVATDAFGDQKDYSVCWEVRSPALACGCV